jgi:2-dehydro-3-deoxyphosphooctonate aldolase (KDO 8-P synthase)
VHRSNTSKTVANQGVFRFLTFNPLHDKELFNAPDTKPLKNDLHGKQTAIMKQKTVRIGDIEVGNGAPLVLIAGPCVIEEAAITIEIAAYLHGLTRELGIPFIFKSSYDKANRTALDAYRGPGLEKGLEILDTIRKKFGVPVLSDVHRIQEIESAAEVLDIIQIPAFLCRQTDFITAVADAGKPVNIKKGQFLAPWDMAHVINKVTATGNHRLLLTDRGTMFGYNNLIADFRSIQVMQEMGWPVVFDATHSVQLPGGAGTHSGGERKFAPILARAGVAAGADAVFLEVHSRPEGARCDGPNSLSFDALPDLLRQLKSIHHIVSDTTE